MAFVFHVQGSRPTTIAYHVSVVCRYCQNNIAQLAVLNIMDVNVSFLNWFFWEFYVFCFGNFNSGYFWELVFLRFFLWSSIILLHVSLSATYFVSPSVTITEAKEKLRGTEFWFPMALLQLLKEPSLVLAFSFLILLLKFFFKDKSGKRKLKLPPSPPKLPVIGNLHQLRNKPHISLRGLAEKYGPLIYLKLGEIPTVVVSSARVAKEVLKTHDLALSSRPQIFSAKHLFYNCTDVVFSPYNAYWRHIRKICILELLSAKRVQSYSHVREEEVARLVCRVAESYPGTTNLTKILGLYANDVLCRVAFGRGFSEGGDYDRHGFQKMLEEYQELLGGFSIGDFFPSMEFIHSLTGMKSRLQETFRRFDELFNHMVTDHLNPNREKEKHKDLVDVLLDVQKSESAEIPLTMDNVKAIILDMFAAGTDTTFITLDWGMTDLLMNPKVLGRAQAEVRGIVGERRVVLESDLPQLDYLKAFGAGRRGCPAITFGTATVELALAQLLHSFDWELPPGTTAKDLDLAEVFGITMHRIDNLIVVARPRFP